MSSKDLQIAIHRLTTAKLKESQARTNFTTSDLELKSKDAALKALPLGDPGIPAATAEVTAATAKFNQAKAELAVATNERVQAEQNLQNVQPLAGFTALTFPGAPSAPSAPGVPPQPPTQPAQPKIPPVDREDKEALDDLYKKKNTLIDINKLMISEQQADGSIINKNVDVTVEKVVVMQPEAKKISTLQDAIKFLDTHKAYYSESTVEDGYVFYLDKQVYDIFENQFKSVAKLCAPITGKNTLPIEQITNENIANAFKGYKTETDKVLDKVEQSKQAREAQESEFIALKLKKEPKGGYVEVVGIYISSEINQQSSQIPNKIYDPTNNFAPLSPKFTFSRTVNPAIFIPKILTRTLKYFLNDPSNQGKNFLIPSTNYIYNLIYDNVITSIKDISTIKNEYQLYPILLEQSLYIFRKHSPTIFPNTIFTDAAITSFTETISKLAISLNRGILRDSSGFKYPSQNKNCYNIFKKESSGRFINSGNDKNLIIYDTNPPHNILSFDEVLNIVKDTINYNFLHTGDFTNTGPNNLTTDPTIFPFLEQFINSFKKNTTEYYPVTITEVNALFNDASFDGKIKKIAENLVKILPNVYSNISFPSELNNTMYFMIGILYTTIKLSLNNIFNVILQSSDIDKYIEFLICNFIIGEEAIEEYEDDFRNDKKPKGINNLKEKSLYRLLKKSYTTIISNDSINDFVEINLNNYNNIEILNNYVSTIFYKLFSNSTDKINQADINFINIDDNIKDIKDIKNTITNFTNARCYNLESLYLSLKIITIICLLFVNNILDDSGGVISSIKAALSQADLSITNIEQIIKPVFDYISLEQIKNTNTDNQAIINVLTKIDNDYLNIRYNNYGLTLWESIILGIDINDSNETLSSYYNDLKQENDPDIFTNKIKNTLIYDLSMIKYISDDMFRLIISDNSSKNPLNPQRLFLFDLKNTFLMNDIFFISYFETVEEEQNNINHIGSLLSLSYEILLKQLKDTTFKANLDTSVINVYKNYNKLSTGKFYLDFVNNLSDSFVKNKYFMRKNNERRTSACFEDTTNSSNPSNPSNNKYDISLYDENLFRFTFDSSIFKTKKNIINYNGFNSIIEKISTQNNLFINRLVLPQIDDTKFNHIYSNPLDKSVKSNTEDTTKKIFEHLYDINSSFDLGKLGKIMSTYYASIGTKSIDLINKYTYFDNTPLFMFNKNYLIYINDTPDLKNPTYKKLIYIIHNELDKDCLKLNNLNNTIEITFDSSLKNYYIKDILININDNFILNDNTYKIPVKYQNTFNFYKDISDAELLLKCEENKDYSDLQKLNSQNHLKNIFKLSGCRLVNYNDFNNINGCLFNLIQPLRNNNLFLNIVYYYNILVEDTPGSSVYYFKNNESTSLNGNLYNNIIYNDVHKNIEKLIKDEFNTGVIYYDGLKKEFYKRSSDIYRTIPEGTLNNNTLPPKEKNISSDDEKAQLLLFGFIKDMHELCEGFTH